MKYVFVSPSPKDTLEFGIRLGRLLKSGDIVCLEGELGAGKTLLTRGIAKGMGIDYPVSSPTYTLINEYSGPVPLYHFDLYRLDDEDELYYIGGEELLFDAGVSVIEWAPRMKEFLPEERLWIKISRVQGEDSKRLIEVTAEGKKYGRVVEGVMKNEGTGN
jgi:tRNA threonylcarbamoyladenosine biosynthesis protein TsaE